MSKRPTRSTSIPASRNVQSMVPGRRGFDAGADLVWNALELRRWSVTDLAKASGVSRVALSNWLNGRRPLRGDYLLAAIAALDLAILPASLSRSRAQVGGQAGA